MTQLLTTANRPTERIESVSFMYDGVSRVVDNIDRTHGGKIIVGFEMRKAGKFSYKIKRYSADKIVGMHHIHAPIRVGPKIGRPTA